MSDVNLMPVLGMNTVAEDAALVGESGVYVRDASNINITPAGKIRLRENSRLATATRYKNLWQSPLHKDVFGTLNDDWVRISPDDWTCEILTEVGEGVACHAVVNNQVVVAAPRGLFQFNGSEAVPLTIPTPPAPLVVANEGGESVTAGTYGVAVAWLRGKMESATSMISSVTLHDNGELTIMFPSCFDMTVTGVRLYLTAANGGELYRAEDYPITSMSVTIPLLPERGAPPQFQYLSPMPTGKYLCYWRGRLLTAIANVLRFSEAMAFHLHDERHGFVQFPQRITFVIPVNGGIWVGQTTHVVFLAGSTPSEMTINRKGSQAPVPDSALLVDADTLGADLAQGGAACALWLAENGYVVGTPDGQTIELHAGKLSGIQAASSTSVVLDNRVLTVIG